MRFRSADDVEKIIRENHAQGIYKFFITDDNCARNRNWEAIFDRLIKIRQEKKKITLFIQVDTLCHSGDDGDHGDNGADENADNGDN